MRRRGWGWDAGRRLRFRRVDRYLTPLAARGLLADHVREIPGFPAAPPGPRGRAERLSTREIPLFLGLRAVKR